MPADRGQPTGDQPTPQPTGPRPGQAAGAVPAPFLEAVIADAASKAGVGIDDVRVTRASAVQWRDGSLGCPEPGMMYIQVIVDGYWVELLAGGAPYDYRLDGRGRFVLCTRPDRQAPYAER